MNSCHDPHPCRLGTRVRAAALPLPSTSTFSLHFRVVFIRMYYLYQLQYDSMEIAPFCVTYQAAWPQLQGCAYYTWVRPHGNSELFAPFTTPLSSGARTALRGVVLTCSCFQIYHPHPPRRRRAGASTYGCRDCPQNGTFYVFYRFRIWETRHRERWRPTSSAGGGNELRARSCRSALKRSCVG